MRWEEGVEREWEMAGGSEWGRGGQQQGRGPGLVSSGVGEGRAEFGDE